VQVATSYCKPKELIFDKPLTTMPVKGRVYPVNEASPASVTFLQYETSRKDKSFSLDINLIVWSSTAFSQPDSCSSWRFKFCFNKN